MLALPQFKIFLRWSFLKPFHFSSNSATSVLFWLIVPSLTFSTLLNHHFVTCHLQYSFKECVIKAEENDYELTLKIVSSSVRLEENKGIIVSQPFPFVEFHIHSLPLCAGSAFTSLPPTVPVCSLKYFVNYDLTYEKSVCCIYLKLTIFRQSVK